MKSYAIALCNFLKWFALIYFLAMVAHYGLTMNVFPEKRWFGGTIPIFLHWVLALYLYLLPRHFRRLPLGATTCN